VPTKLLIVIARKYLHWLSPKDEEVLSTHHHEAHELFAQNLFNFISLGVCEGRGAEDHYQKCFSANTVHF